MKFVELFGRLKSVVIGMVHVQALPGSYVEKRMLSEVVFSNPVHIMWHRNTSEHHGHPPACWRGMQRSRDLSQRRDCKYTFYILVQCFQQTAEHVWIILENYECDNSTKTLTLPMQKQRFWCNSTVLVYSTWNITQTPCMSISRFRIVVRNSILFEAFHKP